MRTRRREARHGHLRDLVQRRCAAAVQSRRRAAPLVRVRAGDRGVQRDADDRSVVRDGGVGHRAEPLEQSVRSGHPPGRACCSRGARPSISANSDRRRRPSASAPTSTPWRGCTTTARRPISARASRRIATRWRSSRRAYPERHRGGDLLCAVDRRGRVADRQDLRRAAQGRRDPREADCRASRIIRAWRTTSSTATTCRRSPIARSRRRGATRRSRRRRRTRCTCRRTRSRASATGRSRSTPTSHPARSRRREGSVAEELHTMDYRVYAYLQTGQDRERAATARGAAGGRGAIRSRRDRIGRAGLGRRLRAGGDSGALRARARRLGRGGEARGAARASFRIPKR